MTTIQLMPVGTAHAQKGAFFIRLAPEYIPALQALDGFSHLQVLWWCSEFDTEEARRIVETPQPYRNAPAVMGIFSTRSPVRPNPIALTTVEILQIDFAKGILHVAYLDTHDNTPVLDIKPYTPSMDRVLSPRVPAWCAHWPESLEDSENFDWESEFTF